MLFGWFEVLFIAIAQDVVYTCNLDGLWGYWENFYGFFFGVFVFLRIESAEVKLCSFGTYSLSIFVDIWVI